jgi:SWI/SNF-related matrix-associated actin-dependent regulator of chromatin subfamily A member 5
LGVEVEVFYFPTGGKTHSRKKNSKTHLENSGVGNVYEYKDGEEGGDAATAAGADGEALRALIGNNWIDPPKRERKRVQSYNEAEAFRQTLKPGGGGGPRASAAPRLPKMPQLQDFQFYDVPRITALYEKEANFEAHKHSLAEKARSARAQGASEEVVQAQIAPGPDDPQPLSEEEVAEREALLSSGFANWNRRDFGAFIRACEKVRRRGREFFFSLEREGGSATTASEKRASLSPRTRKNKYSPSSTLSPTLEKKNQQQYGRNDPVRIATEVDGKSEAEVAAYLEVFRQRCSELNESERLLRNIHRGEERLARHAEVADLIRAKLAQYKNPWSELRLSYGAFFFYKLERDKRGESGESAREREREREKNNSLTFFSFPCLPARAPTTAHHHHQQAPTRARPTPRRRTASSSAPSRSWDTAAGTSSRPPPARRTASASTGTSRAARRRSWRAGATR